MPIYEYRCPEGHSFELLQRMTDPPPGDCQICGASPVTKVLYPAAVHFKGSGFYTTDYGRGGRRRDALGDGASPSESAKSGEKSEKGESATGKSDSGKSDSGKSDSASSKA